MSFDIIIDTREQTPWHFTDACVNTIVCTSLKTGDYTIVGFEDILCIERKRSVSEIARNVTEDRFIRELERMAAFPYSFLICEFAISDILVYPMGSDIPKNRWRKIRIRAPFILKRLSQIMINYHIPILFCENAQNASTIALNIMKRTYEKYEEQQKIN